MEPASIPMLVQTMSQMFPQDVSIAIADASKFIFYQPSKLIDLKIKPGDTVKEGTVTHRALHARQKVTQYVESDVYGVPYFGMSIPFVLHGMPEGCVTAIFPRAVSPEPVTLPRNRMLVGKAEDRWVPLPFSQIVCISAHEGKTWLHTLHGKYQNKYSLTDLQTILPTDSFVRCHRSFFVNVNEIAEIQPDFHSTFILVMRDEGATRIPVSQTYAGRFRQLLGF